MRVIADELHCTAVRISGGDPERLSVAAGHAADAGLEVWFAPFPCDLTAERMLPFFADCAGRAERLRAAGARVVFVAGCELSLFGKGFLPGETLMDRMRALQSPDPALWEQFGDILARFNRFLAEAAGAVRKEFGGQVTYAAGPWERLDWTPFDIVSVDAYRADYNDKSYRDEVRGHFAHGKPVAATEFGCCGYRGAAGRGGIGWAIIDHAADPPRLDGEYVRDEQEQVRYFTEVLDVLEAEGVDSAFWFTFAGYNLPHRPGDPIHDLDMASYGAVAMHEDGVAWDAKAVFRAIADRYGAAGS
jgi:hypothetical protein